MRIEVTVQAYDDLGGSAGSGVVWGYQHQEQIPQEVAEGVDFEALLTGARGPTEEERRLLDEAENRNSGSILEELMKRIEEARESIQAQAAAGLPRRGDGSLGS